MKRGQWVTCRGTFQGVLGVVTRVSINHRWADVRWISMPEGHYRVGDYYAKRMALSAVRAIGTARRSVLGPEGHAVGVYAVYDAGKFVKIVRETEWSTYSVTHVPTGHSLGHFDSIADARAAVARAGDPPDDLCDIDALYAWGRRMRDDEKRVNSARRIRT